MKGSHYYLGMKAHIGVVHSMVVNVATMQVDKLLHGEENMVGADASHTGVEKPTEHGGQKVTGNRGLPQYL